MLVDSIGDVTITNDGATILKMLEVHACYNSYGCALYFAYIHAHDLASDPFVSPPPE